MSNHALDRHTLSTLTGIELDYHMYCHACAALDKTADRAEFDRGYQEGRYHFSTDKALLPDLMQTYGINLQQLAGEWLASTAQASVYSASPIEAACRLTLILREARASDSF